MSTKKSDNGSTFRRYIALLMELQGTRIRLALACMLISGLLNGMSLIALVPLLQLIGVDNGPRNGMVERVSQFFSQSGLPITLGTVLAAFVVVFVAHSLFVRWLNLVNADLEQSFTKKLQQHLYASIMSADWTFFLTHRNSDLTFALTQNVQRVATGTMSFLRLMSTLVISLIHVSLCIIIAPLMSLLMLLFGAAFSLVVMGYNIRIRRTAVQVVGLNKKLYGIVTDYLSGMKEAKSACSEQRQIDSFAQSSNELRRTWLQSSRSRENTNLAYRLSSVLILSLVVVTAIKFYDTPLIEVMLLVIIASRLLPRIQAVYTNWQQITQMLPAFESIILLLQQSDAAREVRIERVEQPVSFNKEIRLNGVDFSYTDEAVVLKNIQMRIPVGETVAIVGASGAGKSTLADLLMGLLMPQRGEMLVDDRCLSGELVRHWRHQVGYVPQETYLLHETLRSNLLWSNPAATDEQLWEALRMASADTFVAALADGLETVVGDRGVRLSGGERQRIALARALVRQPKLLILDEATSSLDGENQQHIQKAISSLRGRTTVVIIAHRLSSVMAADQIIVLEEGRILESGSFDDLIKHPETRFRKMLRSDSCRAA